MSTNAAAAIALLNDAMALVVNGTAAMTSISTMLGRAQAEGRDITDDELDGLRQQRQRLQADLQAEINRRQGDANG